MSDPAFELLRPTLQRTDGNSLWIADENLLGARLTVNPAVLAISNRFDLAHQLQQAGWRSEFSDFDLSGIADGSIDRLIYRVSKEKPVVHHIINEAYRLLKPGGQLLLAGAKGEGIKSYIDKAGKLFHGDCDAEKASKDYWLATLTRPDEPAGPELDDQDYRQLRECLADDRFSFSSKPGQYGWNKLDKGSALLIEQLPQFLEALPGAPERILDLGCGYGYLALHASRLGAPVTATDNNAAALTSCKANFARYAIDGEVIAADCADRIDGRYELILCNPPFHAGFSVEGDLTDRFLQAAHDRLSRHGIACFVVNQHIPLERKAAPLFGQVETLLDSGNFKLVRLSQPR
ncbi:methyltransferase [Marinobacterium arenosum]|uniref:methyltransferase n=1 Tax=Marinobacterium arenosum TaxID=2862496 RepID=UPI001C967BFE|nr:methyltransferase [Marinobacterium arenosum]MBY4678280.1 methyltransferase [Marinobacterium arenosum]